MTKIIVACGFLVAAWDIGEGQFGLRKRLLDLALAAVALFVEAPLLLIITCIVAVSSPGPILVRQIRIGRNGRPFRTFKFRTMYEDAEDRLHRYLASNDDAQRQWANTRKLRFDPRVTAIGAMLQKSSLDQLPQLFNVFAGDMSLVGPRPLTEVHSSTRTESTDAHATCKPGMTGLWMFGRHFKEASYTSNWSLMLDVKIILATIPTLLVEEANGGDEKDFETKWIVGLAVIVSMVVLFGMFITLITH